MGFGLRKAAHGRQAEKQGKQQAVSAAEQTMLPPEMVIDHNEALRNE
jgi:hypothetical protein